MSDYKKEFYERMADIERSLWQEAVNDGDEDRAAYHMQEFETYSEAVK